MFKINKSKATVDYLADAEFAHSQNKSLALDTEKLAKYLSKEGIKSDKLTPEIFGKYLEQENNHYGAKFTGGLADLWNLEYSKENFAALMSGHCPKSPEEFKELHGYKLKTTGKLINSSQNQQAGTDLLSAVPKSISIEFARSSKDKRDKIYFATEKTDSQMFDLLAKQIKPSCKKGEYQDFLPEKTKIFVASFTHYEDRGLDPHLHRHHSLMNFAEFEFKDGTKKILAIDPEKAFKCQLENSAFYDTLLNSNLQKEGFITEPCETEQGHKTFRIKGYTREQELSMSKRKTEIKDFVDEQKKLGNYFSSSSQEDTAFEESVRANTAKVKVTHNCDEILEIIKNEAEKNISNKEFSEIDRIQNEGRQKFVDTDYLKIMKAQQLETNGVIDETKLKTSIIQELRFLKVFDNPEDLSKEVDKAISVLSSEAMGENRLIKMSSGKFTRLDIAVNEKVLNNNIEWLQSTSREISTLEEKSNRRTLSDFIKENNLTGFKLNSGQVEACKLIIKESNVSLVIGDAGTGKTSTLIKFANEFYTKKNKKVFGISTGTSTSKDLAEANVKSQNCLNTKQFISNAFNKDTGEIKPSFLEENKGSVLILDEAGMIGAEDYRKITDWAKKSSSKIVLVGDQKQLAAVSYGNSFVAIQNILEKSNTARLEENCRQRNQSAKDVAEGYRDKDIEKVFKALDKEGWLTTAKTDRDIAEALCKDYLADKSKSKIIICGVNAEIDFINDTIRKEFIKSEAQKEKSDKSYKSNFDYKNSHSIKVERKSGTHTNSYERSFCKGDEVVFLENYKDKDKKFQIDNSNRGVIKEIEPLKNGYHKLTVEINKKTVSFSTKDYKKFNHCFAISSHKSQGKTVDNTYHLGNSFTSNNKSYVDGSRHKDTYKLYLKQDEVEKFKRNAIKEQIKETTINDDNCKIAVSDYIKEKATKNRQLSPVAPKEVIKSIDKDELKARALRAHTNTIQQQELERKAQEKAIAEKAREKTSLPTSAQRVADLLNKPKKATYPTPSPFNGMKL